jgi:hypothetical protein
MGTMANSNTYSIDVLRKSKDGTLSFSNGSINIVTTCWWDPEVVMPGALVYQMWSSINPKEQPVITVTVRDETVSRGVVVPYKCMVANWM